MSTLQLWLGFTLSYHGQLRSVRLSAQQDGFPPKAKWELPAWMGGRCGGKMGREMPTENMASSKRCLERLGQERAALHRGAVPADTKQGLRGLIGGLLLLNEAVLANKGTSDSKGRINRAGPRATCLQLTEPGQTWHRRTQRGWRKAALDNLNLHPSERVMKGRQIRRNSARRILGSRSRTSPQSSHPAITGS